MTASTIIVQPDTHQLRACSAGHRTTGVSNYFFLELRKQGALHGKIFADASYNLNQQLTCLDFRLFIQLFCRGTALAVAPHELKYFSPLLKASCRTPGADACEDPSAYHSSDGRYQSAQERGEGFLHTPYLLIFLM